MSSCNSEDFRNKEVICIEDGRRLGYVAEIEFDVCDGRITAIVVCTEGGLFSGRGRLLIGWECIRKIGEDIILVDGIPLPGPEECHKSKRRGRV